MILYTNFKTFDIYNFNVARLPKNKCARLSYLFYCTVSSDNGNDEKFSETLKPANITLSVETSKASKDTNSLTAYYSPSADRVSYADIIAMDNLQKGVD